MWEKHKKPWIFSILHNRITFCHHESFNLWLCPQTRSIPAKHIIAKLGGHHKSRFPPHKIKRCVFWRFGRQRTTGIPLHAREDTRKQVYGGDYSVLPSFSIHCMRSSSTSSPSARSIARSPSLFTAATLAPANSKKLKTRERRCYSSSTFYHMQD